MNFRKLWKTWSPVLFVVPALIFYIIFVFYPVLGTIRFSMSEWNGVSAIKKFVGMRNYVNIINDISFWTSLLHNIIWIVVTIAIPTVLALFLAIALTTPQLKGVTFFRVTLFMPSIVSMVVVSIVWKWIFNQSFGTLNQLLKAVGLSSLTNAWLGNPKTALGALLTAGSWTHYGFCMVILLAALQGLDETYIEAAKIDGANALQCLVFVKLPLLKNTVTLVVLNSMIGSFKVFDIIWVSTQGGPYHSTDVVSTYLYNHAFVLNRIGEGAAAGVILMIIIMICSIIYFKISERE